MTSSNQIRHQVQGDLMLIEICRFFNSIRSNSDSADEMTKPRRSRRLPVKCPTLQTITEDEKEVSGDSSRPKRVSKPTLKKQQLIYDELVNTVKRDRRKHGPR